VTELDVARKRLYRGHYYCDDCWYSCPQAEDGTCDPAREGKPCDCGADSANAFVDAFLVEVERLRAVADAARSLDHLDMVRAQWAGASGTAEAIAALCAALDALDAVE
jgi:hypothetical protein